MAVRGVGGGVPREVIQSDRADRDTPPPNPSPTPDSFRDFVTGVTPALSRTAYLLTGDHQLAEDLLQSALAKAYQHWRRIAGGNPEGYVRTVMHHEFISWWRRSRRRVPEQLSADPARHGGGVRPAHHDPAEHTALRLAVADALARLTRKQRAVLVLRFYDDLTEAETARVLGCSLGTVKRHGHAALTRLRQDAPHLLNAEWEART
jgi:RNA polymerase sigma-70 factor (sigma-E family)